jgi:hypothetical protein
MMSAVLPGSKDVCTHVLSGAPGIDSHLGAATTDQVRAAHICSAWPVQDALTMQGDIHQGTSIRRTSTLNVDDLCRV